MLLTKEGMAYKPTEDPLVLNAEDGPWAGTRNLSLARPVLL